MDEIDAELLAVLQEDAEVSNKALAERIGLSTAGIHKRRKRLKKQGLIRRIAAVLDRDRLELDLLCFLLATFKTNTNPRNMELLQSAVRKLPEVLECFTVTGAHDVILKIVVRDHHALKRFLKELSEAQDVIDRVHTAIALEEIKSTNALPLHTAETFERGRG